MEKLIVDRIENGKVICENSLGETVVVDNPPECREGDCLELTDKGYVVNADATNQRREKIQGLFDRLKKK